MAKGQYRSILNAAEVYFPVRLEEYSGILEENDYWRGYHHPPAGFTMKEPKGDCR